MKLIISLIGCILLFCSCNGGASSSSEYEYLTTNMKETDIDEPYLYLEANNKYDFGTVKEEKTDVIPMIIEIGNSGNTPLVIFKADVSCGCVSVEYPKEPIQPGKTAKLNIKVNTKGQKGYFNKTVFLNSNATNDVTLIRIIGKIK